jgi:hypothetical protein
MSRQQLRTFGTNCGRFFFVVLALLALVPSAAASTSAAPTRAVAGSASTVLSGDGKPSPAPATASVSFPHEDIFTSGPLTMIGVGTDLSCQVAFAGDSNWEFYGPDEDPADCGTLLSVGGHLYAPDFTQHDYTATDSLGSYTPFTPVGQTGVMGSGTAADPYTVETSVLAGSTNVELTQADSYVVGSNYLQTDVTLSNGSETSQTVILYRAEDDYLANSDDCTGLYYPSSGAIGCAEPGGRTLEVVPRTSGSSYLFSTYDAVWQAIGSQQMLPNTCDCDISEDGGAALSWNVTVPAGQSITVSASINFGQTTSTLTLLNHMQVQPCGKRGCGTAGITAQLIGPDGMPVPNQLITLNLTPAGSTKKRPPPPPTPAPQRTDFNGRAFFSFTASTPEAFQVHATATDPATGQTLISNEADVYFTPPPSTLSPISALAWTGGGNCSGSVVGSSSRLIVVTAAHCVTDAGGSGYWQVGPAYDFAQPYAPYGVWTVTSYVFDQNNFPGNEAYDYAFFVIAPDDNGRTIEETAGGFGTNFSATPGRGFSQYAYPAAAGPGGPAGLVMCKPKNGTTAYEQEPDPNGAAMYNLSCNNPDAFIGSSSGGPLINSSNAVAGVLQGPKTGPFFNGVVGPFLSPAALPLFDSANSAACSQPGVTWC